MATSKNYLEYIKEQVADCPEVAFRPMMGEYVLYFDGKVIGGIYDDRLLLKPTETNKALLPDATLVLPYPGAKPMLLFPDPDDRDLLRRTLIETANALPRKK